MMAVAQVGVVEVAGEVVRAAVVQAVGAVTIFGFEVKAVECVPKVSLWINGRGAKMSEFCEI